VHGSCLDYLSVGETSIGSAEVPTFITMIAPPTCGAKRFAQRAIGTSGFRQLQKVPATAERRRFAAIRALENACGSVSNATLSGGRSMLTLWLIKRPPSRRKLPDKRQAA